jgi:hypothetical protein
VKFTERTVGVYRAKFVGVTPLTITDKVSKEEKEVWVWKWQELADPTTAGELDTITGNSFKSRNAVKLFTGMLGRPPTESDDTDALIGQDFDVVYGPNQGGRLTVTGAVRPQGVPTPVVAGLPAVDTTPPGDLPF